MNNKIICPNCKTEISVDEMVRHEMEGKLRLEIGTEEKEKFTKERLELEKKLGDEKGKFEKEREELEKRVIDRYKEESEKESRILKERVGELEEKNSKLVKEEEELLRKTRSLEDREKELNLEVEKRISEVTKKTWDEVSYKKDEEYRLKIAEEEKVKSDLLKQIAELKQKAEQGSQQLQGEVLELELEKFLTSEFPTDVISPVGKGVSGADVIQEVRDHNGRLAGVIIWESKRTKSFDKDWIGKLKSNSIEAKADVAILVSQVLPEGLRNFGPREGVYVTSFECLLEVARLIRGTLIKVSQSREASVGKNEKMEVLWRYLTSSEFSQRMAMVVDTIMLERNEIERERVAYTRMWANREKRLGRIMDNMSSVYGDLQGLMGKSLPELQTLALDSGEEQVT